MGASRDVDYFRQASWQGLSQYSHQLYPSARRIGKTPTAVCAKSHIVFDNARTINDLLGFPKYMTGGNPYAACAGGSIRETAVSFCANTHFVYQLFALHRKFLVASENHRLLACKAGKSHNRQQ